MARKQRGGRGGKGRRKFKRIAKGANNFLRKTKLISKSAGILSDFGVPHAGRVGSVAGQLGYGSKYANKYMVAGPRGIKV